MAHIKKIPISAAHDIIAHDFRQPQSMENPFFKTRERIDNTRSNLNEYLVLNGIKAENVFNKYEQELKQCKLQKRSDVNTLVSVVVTLPKDITAGTEEEKIFFDATRDFLQNRWENTYLADAIHRDEKRPHMHYLLIPKVKEIKAEKVRDPKTGKLKKTGRKIETGRMKISAKELITRDDVTRFHHDLNEYMKNVFGREIEILNGITEENGGNKTISELKLFTAQKEAEEAKEAAKQKEIAAIKTQTDAKEEKEQYHKLSANLAKINVEKIRELSQREKIISEAEAEIKRNVAKAEADQKEAKAKKIEAQKKIDQLKQQEIDIRQRLIDVEAADARLKTKEKSLEKREKAIQEREIAIEETRPDLRAQRLKEEISKLSEKLSAPELKPIKKEEIEEIARGEAEPRYKELYVALKKYEKAYERGSGDMVQITNDIRITKSKIEQININIGNDPAKCAKADAKYRELQENEAKKEQLRQALSQKLNTKKIEFEYNSSGAALWLIENAAKWPQIAKIIDEQREKESKIAQKQSERQSERQSEIRVKPKTRSSFER